MIFHLKIIFNWMFKLLDKLLFTICHEFTGGRGKSIFYSLSFIPRKLKAFSCKGRSEEVQMYFKKGEAGGRRGEGEKREREGEEERRRRGGS